MKKTLIILSSLFLAQGFVQASTDRELLSAPTYTMIVRTKGGLFGYDYVNTSQSFTNPQNVITACSDPGLKRCKVEIQALTNVPSVLNPSQLEEIDNQVNQKIADTKVNGNFAYGSNFFVVYTFELAVSKIQYTIYTKDEANALGYEF